MVRFIDGSPFTDFAHAFYKYPNRGFWQSGPNVFTGALEPGPRAGLVALRTTAANPLYQWPVKLGFLQNWKVGVWIKPYAIASPVSFLLLQDDSVPPNLVTVGVVQIKPDGTIIVASGNGANVFVSPSSFDLPKLSTPFVSSHFKVPFGVWTHICAEFQIPPGASGGFGTIKLYINGSLDSTATSVAFGAFAAGGANILTGCWTSSGGNDMDRSQVVVFDSTGSQNNGAPQPGHSVLGVAATADVANGGWVSNLPGANVLAVNENPGPDLDTSYLTIAALSSPDQLFAVGNAGGRSSYEAIALNICSHKVGSATLQGLAKSGMAASLVGSALAVPSAAYATQQALSELSPFSGLKWTDLDLSTAVFGWRGISGTGEHVSQFFVEKLQLSGLGSYGF